MVALPLANLGQLAEQEDTLSLSPSNGLHDPRLPWVPPECLHKEGIIAGQHEGQGQESIPLGFGHAVHFLQLLLHPLEVFH